MSIVQLSSICKYSHCVEQLCQKQYNEIFFWMNNDWLQTQILLKKKKKHLWLNSHSYRKASRLNDVDMQRLYASSLHERYLFPMHQYCGDVRSYRAGKLLDNDSRLANCQPAVQPDWSYLTKCQHGRRWSQKGRRQVRDTVKWMSQKFPSYLETVLRYQAKGHWLMWPASRGSILPTG